MSDIDALLKLLATAKETLAHELECLAGAVELMGKDPSDEHAKYLRSERRLVREAREHVARIEADLAAARAFH